MSKPVQRRRDFLATAAIAGAAPSSQAAQPPAPSVAKSETSTAPSAAARTIQYPRTFTGRNLAMLAFPLGGVAAGS